MAGSTTEILAKLGIDTAQVPKDLEKADAFFKKFSRSVEQEGGKAGQSSGSKFVKGFGQQLSGSGLGGALAAALGLNIGKIAEKVAERFQEAFGGGTKAAFEEAGKIADEVAKRQAEAVETRLSAAQKIAKAEAEIAKAVERQVELSKVPNKTADQLKQVAEAQLQQLDAEKRLRELREKDADAVKKLAEAQRTYDREKLTKAQQILALEKEMYALTMEGSKATLTAGERAEKRLEILERAKKIDELTKEIAEERKTAEEKVTREKERQADLSAKIAKTEKQIQSGRQEVADKKFALGDRSKLTVAELAALPGEQRQAAVDAAREDARRAEAFRFGSSLDDAGLSDEQRRQRAQARQVLDLEAEAEKARLSGDRGKSEDLFQRVGQLREQLVSSGAIKSTEGDQQKAALAEIKKQTEAVNELVQEVKAAKAAKLKNQ